MRGRDPGRVAEDLHCGEKALGSFPEVEEWEFPAGYGIIQPQVASTIEEARAVIRDGIDRFLQ
ncbi:MAG: hypothetical protein HPY89_05930 [Pelotomaculum sp.]|nr:hypothetical protein [Pelotomaculum sp.]